MMSLILKDLDKYMFSSKHMTNYNKIHYTNTNKPIQLPVPVPVVQVPVPVVHVPVVPVPVVPVPVVPVPVVKQAIVPVSTPVPAPMPKKDDTSFTPFQKDKLFWCFYILLKGYEDYEFNKTNSFSIEKKIKIETVEKLKGIKEKLKELKLKRTELEDNLVNQSTISLKGLYALCLVHNISITYIYGRKYCEINHNIDNPTNIMIENSLHYEEVDFLKNVRENYWHIENIQKPLNAPSAYSLKEMQDICNKLQITLETTVNEKPKLKTKTKLYEEILAHI